MFFVDKPFVSDFFKETVRDHAIPVVDTEISRSIGLYPGTKIITEAEAISAVQGSGEQLIYTTSENALAWIIKNLAFSDLVEKIELFKNKVTFRELTKPLVPDFFFQEVCFEDLKNLPHPAKDIPLIIKPATGFMSEGVYKVKNAGEWDQTKQRILADGERSKGLYPPEVVNASALIIEECIQGDEYAVDAYFDTAGEAVILNILKHTFSSTDDVGDRVYTSSKEIIEDNLQEFTEFSNKIGQLANVRNFPAHIELRRIPDGTLIPIEINPVRFGGWCTTADLTYLAYGFNPYVYFYKQIKPDWPNILKNKSGKLYSIIILDNSTGIDPALINGFDYQKLLSNFESPLELRKFDYSEYPVFGFLFTETNVENELELKKILVSDLQEFITATDVP
ncbi:MAG: ATP-grasp domain-containing protein [Chloroflexota bacterium]|nr:MAG: ATP-grasp domain-containing protein [Chloroflexota bacterium]